MAFDFSSMMGGAGGGKAAAASKGIQMGEELLSMLAGTVHRGMEMAELPENNIGDQLSDLYVKDYNVSSLDELSDLFNSTQFAKTNYRGKDFWGMTGDQAAGKIALNALHGGIEGAKFGTSIAPGWGTLIGAAIGTTADALGSGFGWLSRKNKASKMAGQYNHEGLLANNKAINDMQTASTNISKNVFNNAWLNYGAYGGPLYINDFFTNGVRKIENGGTHEQNPLSGVPMGIAADGLENLVEQGELIYNDYVFSQRLMVPEANKAMLGLSKKKNYTFAEAAEQIQRESEERPNDPISKKTLDEMMGRLQEAQETVKAKKEARRLRNAYNKLSPLDKLSLAYAMQQPQEVQQPMFDGGGALGGGGGTPWGMILDKVFDTAGQVVDFGSGILDKKIQQEQAKNPIFQINPNFTKQTSLSPLLQYAKGGKLAHMHAQDGSLNNPWENLTWVDSEDLLGELLDGQYKVTRLNPYGKQQFAIATGDPTNAWNLHNAGTEESPIWTVGAAPRKTIYWNNTTDKDWSTELPASVGDGQYVVRRKTPAGQMLYYTATGNPEDATGIYKDKEGNWNVGTAPSNAAGNPMAQALRSSSVLGAVYGALNSLFDKPNYAPIERAEKAMAAVPRVSAGHIGQKMPYIPVDPNYVLTQLGNQGIGARRALIEAGAGPQSIIAGNYATQTAMGQSLLEALRENNARRLQALEFNRGTDTTNVGNDFQAALANQRRDLMGANFLLETAPLRINELATLQNQRSAQATNAYNQLHNLGTDMLNRDMALAMAQSYGVPYNASMNAAGQTMSPWYWPQKTNKNGGKLNTKKGGKHA